MIGCLVCLIYQPDYDAHLDEIAEQCDAVHMGVGMIPIFEMKPIKGSKLQATIQYCDEPAPENLRENALRAYARSAIRAYLKKQSSNKSPLP